MSRYAMQTPRGTGIELLLILEFGTKWGEWPVSGPGRALPQECTTGTRIGGWVGLRAGLDTEALSLLRIELWSSTL
jgi:hypothetical protein